MQEFMMPSPDGALPEAAQLAEAQRDDVLNDDAPIDDAPIDDALIAVEQVVVEPIDDAPIAVEQVVVEPIEAIVTATTPAAVSYTHLDVYKRQGRAAHLPARTARPRRVPPEACDA